VHQSLIDKTATVFHDPEGRIPCRPRCAYLAGLIKYAPDYTFFLAPYINSYKRFLPGTFAPTKIVWSCRQPHRRFPAVRRRHQGVRIECRIRRFGHQPLSGACAAQLAAGLSGIEEGLSWMSRLPAMSMAWRREIPAHLARCATETLRNSAMLRKTMGDWVVDHYTRGGSGSRKRSTGGHRLGNRPRF
jgi:glutamine synthetase